MKPAIRTMGERLLRHAGLLFIAFRCALPGFAQLSTSTVMGVVQDATDASISGASVRLINTQTGTENDSTTNQEGSFLLPGVIPGAYTLQIERQGFATTQLNGIVLSVGATRNLLVRMKVGSVSESVTVDASGVTLNSTDASVSTVVDQKFISTIPLNGRSLQDLVSLTPGIVTQSPQAATQGSGAGTQGDFSVNGQKPESNAFFVDGVSANVDSGLASGNARLASTGSIEGSTALGTTQSLLSVDALQEFRVLTSTYSAEYGRTPGGQFTFLTRSGTNTLHGSLYNYFRGDVLDTADWFSTSQGLGFGPPPAHYTQNDFGGTVGAPIVLPHAYHGRDKTFVFGSYEGLYLAQPTPQTYQYAPAVCGAGQFIVSCNVTPDNVPSAISSVLDTFPFAESLEITDAAGNPTGLAHTTISPNPFPSHVNSTSVRTDHIFSPRLSMFFRYGDTPSFSQVNQLWSVTAHQVDTQSSTFGATSQFSATRTNEFRLGNLRSTSSASTLTEPVTNSQTLFPVGNLNAALGIPGSYGSVSADAYVHSVGVGDSDSNTNQINSSLHQWNLRDTFGLQVRSHLFKFGIDQRRIASTVNPPALSIQADFFDRNSLANNAASYLVITKSSPASPILNQFSAFVQDQWRVAPALTMSLGLRWEVNPAPTGAHGQDAFTVKGDVHAPATLQLAPRGTALWHTGWFNLAPRLGADWVANAEPGRELIVRAGWGVFFDTGTQPALSAFHGLGFSTSAHFANVPVPATPAQTDFSAAIAPPYTGSTVFAFPSHLQLPYSMQWNVGLEKALGRNQTLTVSYVGAEGRRLLQEQRTNVSQLNPNFADISYFPAGLTSSFQSLQTKFQRSLSPGVEALVSYTWAHSMDYGSTDPAFPVKYGNSNLDVRHNLEGAISWDMQKFTERPMIKNLLLGGWGADARLIARTGFPVNLAGNFFFDPVMGHPYFSGVDLIPNRPLYLFNNKYPGAHIFNGGPDAINPAFRLPDGLAPGNAPRNLLRGFDAVQLNGALRREIHLHERMNLQVRAETFNVLNHPNFGYIDPNLSDLLFGQSTKMLNQSFGGSGALYQQGGPRAIQLSIKFVF